MIKQKTFETEIEINDFVNTQNINIISIETEKYEKMIGDEFSIWYSKAEKFKMWYNDNN